MSVAFLETSPLISDSTPEDFMPGFEPQPGVSALESEYLPSRTYEKAIQAFLYAVTKVVSSPLSSSLSLFLQPLLLDGRCFHTPRPGSSSAPGRLHLIFSLLEVDHDLLHGDKILVAG